MKNTVIFVLLMLCFVPASVFCQTPPNGTWEDQRRIEDAMIAIGNSLNSLAKDNLSDSDLFKYIDRCIDGLKAIFKEIQPKGGRLTFEVQANFETLKFYLANREVKRFANLYVTTRKQFEILYGRVVLGNPAQE